MFDFITEMGGWRGPECHHVHDKENAPCWGNCFCSLHWNDVVIVDMGQYKRSHTFGCIRIPLISQEEKTPWIVQCSHGNSTHYMPHIHPDAPYFLFWKTNSLTWCLLPTCKFRWPGCFPSPHWDLHSRIVWAHCIPNDQEGQGRLKWLHQIL